MVEKIELNLKSLSDKTAAMSILDKGRVLQYILMECKYGYIPDDEAEADQSIAARILEKGEDGKLHYRDIQNAVKKRIDYCASRKASRAFGKQKTESGKTNRAAHTDQIFADMMEIYNEMAISLDVKSGYNNSLNICSRITTTIRTSLKEFVRSCNQDYVQGYFQDEHHGVDFFLESFGIDEKEHIIYRWIKVCANACISEFLTGEASSGWHADIKFVSQRHEEIDDLKFINGKFSDHLIEFERSVLEGLRRAADLGYDIDLNLFPLLKRQKNFNQFC